MNLLKHGSRAISAHHHSYHLSKMSSFLLLPIFRSSLYSTSYLLNPHQISKIPRTRKTRMPSSSPLPSFQQVKKQAETSPSPPPLPSFQEVKKPAEGVDWPRPAEVPYQAEVVNLVNLIGHIKLPVMFQSFPDGKYRGITFMSQGFGEKSFSIPVIFEGDLAHIVACHLKKNDSVHVRGQLSEDPTPFVLTKNQANYHVVVQDINFVVGFDSTTVEQNSKKIVNSAVEGDVLPEDDVGVLVRNDAIDSFSDKKFGISTSTDAGIDDNVRHWWRELVANPQDWLDIRPQSDGVKPVGPAFKNKGNGRVLWIDSSTPKWILKELESVDFDKKNIMITSPKSSDNMKDGMTSPKSFYNKKNRTTSPKKSRNTKDGDSDSDSWRDLVKNPKQWLDFREKKSKGTLLSKYPDFKHKDVGKGLWLTRAPEWVLPGLENLQFDVDVTKDEVWKSLVENPSKWWDNRSDKRSAKAPDFKHKDTGEALWLNSSPDWVLPKLPPFLKQKQSVKPA